MTSLYKRRPDSGDYASEIQAALDASLAAQTAAELAETNAESAATTATTMAGNASTSASNAASSESTASAASVSATAAKNAAESAAVSAAASEAVVFGAVPATRTVNGLALSSDITLDTSDISDTTDARYVSDADLVNLSNLSGTNTGDQDLSGLVPKTTTVNGHALSGNVTVTKSDVGLGSVQDVDTTNPANITQSASYRFVTDTEKSTWNAKQATLTAASTGDLVKSFSSKSTPASNDALLLSDSADNDDAKEILFSELLTWIKANKSEVVYSGTFSSFPAASGYNVGDQAFASDVGENGTFFVVSSYQTWVPHTGSAILTQLTLPVGKAPTFTGTTNGAITFGTAVSRNDKCYMYYPANSLVASHAAGFYYTECSSTTAAVVYYNTYVPAAGTYPTEPLSKTPFSGAVPGGTGSTAEVTAFIYGVPANIMGPLGVIYGFYGEEHTTGTGKSVRIKVNTTTIATFSSGSNIRSTFSTVTTNIGSTGVQKSYASTSATTANARTVIDTTAAFEISVTLQGAATDHCTLTSCELTLKRSR